MNSYLDTSVFLAILNGEPTAQSFRGLLRELKADKAKIYTSIITIQEASVTAIRGGGDPDEIFGMIGKLARIQTITREIAIRGARLEAKAVDKMRADDLKAEERVGQNRRRKWDCFHIATAQELSCSALYSVDAGMLNRKTYLDITGMEFLPPQPKSLELLFTDQNPPRIQ